MRYLTSLIEKDLKRKMVFISGPRQCGKTTLAKDILRRVPGAYFNWDNDDDRRSIQAKAWHKEDNLLVFDELHKRPKWKQWIKGLYDVQGQDHRFLVTGSARLDVFRRGGDSLLGRYHLWRLHPFTLDERPSRMRPSEALDRLLTLGGFPEPFLDGDVVEARRWRAERYQRVLREDVRDLEAVSNIQGMSMLMDLLRHRVGGLVVVSNLAQELQVSPNTVKNWLEILERMYVIFIVRPLVKHVARAVVKPPKVYFFDNADVIGDEGARFENLIATHIYKWIQWFQDRDGYRYQLHYIRDKDGREVDFVVTREDRVWSLIEAKWADAQLSRSLQYYAQRLSPKKACQVVHRLKRRSGLNAIALEPSIEALAAAERLIPSEP